MLLIGHILTIKMDDFGVDESIFILFIFFLYQIKNI